MMRDKIEKVAILGAGIMGSQLCAHLANIGIHTYLFDLDQNIAESGLTAVKNAKPAAFYSPRYADRITPCNYLDHLDKIKEVDWVIEAIVEKIEFKQKLFEKILPFLSADAIVSSNTSGLSIKEMMNGMPLTLKRRFLITHFFNPPRYMHLLELIPGEETDPKVLNAAVLVGENLLGKGIVYANDTPNFIANRIGIYGMMLTLKLTQEMHLTVEEVDKLTGTVIGRPKSATYRTADLVGLDTLVHVSETAFEKCHYDENRSLFKTPAILQKMIENKMLGAKTKKGFYQKLDQEILSFDFENFEYIPQKPVILEGLQLAKKNHSTIERIKTLINSNDISGKFVWELLANTLIYAANRIPEIAKDVVNIDKAMRWGFGWEIGPFETWDGLGVENTVERMESEAKAVPDWIKSMLISGYNSFYGQKNKLITYFDKITNQNLNLYENPKVMRLHVLKNYGREMKQNLNASLIDLEDNIGLVEFHSIVQPQMNPIGKDIVGMISEGLDDLQQKGFRALVLGHQGLHFTVGANLALIQKYCEEQNWETLERLTKSFQDLNQKIRFSAIPVIAAPFNMCLGGGFEIIGACARRVAYAELYCGLVEFGIGLIPGAGGNLRLLLNNRKAMEKFRPGPFPVVKKTFETIGFAKVSTSAKEAQYLGYLTKEDKIVINLDHLIYEAKQEAIRMSQTYQPPAMANDIYLPGEGGRLAIQSNLDDLVKAGKISKHDALVGKKLAFVLTGGDKGSTSQAVDEQYLLDIEREAFISLCGESLTQQRIGHMLKTGKPLRN